MKKRWTMRRALLVLCIASVVFALLLQTFLFHQSLRRQIRAESISDHELSLNKMQTDLSNFIHTIRGEMLTIYSEQDLIAAMREAAEKDASMKDYYWRSWYFARKRFTKEDQLLAMYLYDTKDHLISSYRYNSVTYPKDIYKAEYDDNSDRVYDYVHGKRTDLMISGYHNSAAKKDIVRFVLKLHNYDADRNALGYLVCDINSAALTSIMAKYVDVEQVCLWLQPLNDRVIAMTGEASESQCRIQKQLAKVVQSHYKSGELEQEYDGNYLIQAARAQGIKAEFVIVSAYADFDFAKQSISLGVIEYLLKPLTRDEAEAVLKKIENKISGKNSYSRRKSRNLRDKYPDAHLMILQALDIIQSGYAGKISQKKLAEDLGLSQEYFSYLFGKNIGENFSTFLREYRIEQAQYMLREEICDQRDVPYQVGFSDSKYFKKVFREVTGKSPSEYLSEIKE